MELREAAPPWVSYSLERADTWPGNTSFICKLTNPKSTPSTSFFQTPVSNKLFFQKQLSNLLASLYQNENKISGTFWNRCMGPKCSFPGVWNVSLKYHTPWRCHYHHHGGSQRGEKLLPPHAVTFGSLAPECQDRASLSCCIAFRH